MLNHLECGGWNNDSILAKLAGHFGAYHGFACRLRWAREGISTMRTAYRKLAREVLSHIPLEIWQFLFPKDLVGFCYHVVSDVGLPHVKHYPLLSTAEFEQDIKYLGKRFSFTSYEELERNRAMARSFAASSAILTFDDGFRQCESNIAPILREHRIPAVFFIVTDLIDNANVFRESIASLCIEEILRSDTEKVRQIALDLNLGTLPSLFEQRGDRALPVLDMSIFATGTDPRLKRLIHWLLTVTESDKETLNEFSSRLGIRAKDYVREIEPYLTKQQICGLSASGFTIGAHSCSHQLLQQISKSEAEREIVESCEIIRDLTGQSTVPFAFPFYGGGLDRSWLRGLRQKHEFIGLFFDTDGVRDDEDFVVQRVFGERFRCERSLDQILRLAWSRPSAWRRRGRSSGTLIQRQSPSAEVL